MTNTYVNRKRAFIFPIFLVLFHTHVSRRVVGWVAVNLCGVRCANSYSPHSEAKK